MQRMQDTTNWLQQNRVLWQQTLVVLAVLLLPPLFAVLLPSQYHLVIIALPFAIAGVLVFVKWPQLGLVALVGASLGVPFDVPVIGLTVALLVALTGFWIGDMIIRERQIALPNSRTVLPLLAFSASAALSMGFGQLPWYPIAPSPFDAQLRGYLIFVLSFTAYFMVGHQIRDIKWLKWMVYLFVGLGSVYLITRAIRPLNPITGQIFNPEMAGSVFWLWMMAIGLSFALFHKELSWWGRGYMLLVAFLTFYVAFFQTRDWTSGWMPSVIVAGMVIFAGRPKFSIAVGIVGIFVVGPMIPDLYQAIAYDDNEYSTITRIEAWNIVWNIISVNPLFGVGPANYKPYTMLYPILGWYVPFNSHNNYMDLLAQTGVFGTAFFAWFLVEAGALGVRLRQRIPEGGFEWAFVVACLAGVPGTAVAAFLGDWVLPFVYNVNMRGMRASIMGWLFLGGLVVLERIYIHNTEKGTGK